MLLSDIYLWLAYSRVSVHKLNKLLDTMTPAELWDSFTGENRYDLDDKAFSTLKRTHSVDFIERAKQYLKDCNIEYITRADPIYPAPLIQREVDPPLAVFYKGNIDILHSKPCIAVVGTRHATQYGKYATERIVGELAERFTVVSGLATGIDGFAHAAALGAGGDTAAVLGSGLFNASPASNIKLFDEICAKGVVLSEYTPDTHATAYTFPQRNRIISGLSKGVLVVEAAGRSGSLITADCALEQGRDVFAVPGDIDKLRSVGTNTLIKRGAVPITCAQDIFDYYDMPRGEKSEKAIELDFYEQRLLDILSRGEMSFDSLVESADMSIAELNTALSQLLIAGLIHERSKNIYCIS